jgi:tetrahydromethanopterin S-methyltransferase subunit G
VTLQEKLQPEFEKIDKRFDTVDNKVAEQFLEVKNHLTQQDSKLETVEHEVSLNSGTSVKDGVNALRREQAEFTRVQKDMLAEQKTARSLQDTTNERIGALRGDLAAHLSYHDGVEDGKKQASKS